MRRVVGQRRHGADVRCAVGDGAQLLQPAGRHQRVAVQQHHVVSGRGAHAGIGTGGKAQVAAVADQPDAPLPRQRIQRRGQLGLRRGIVDHDQPARPPAGRQHAVEAGSVRLGAAMHRHDDIDRAAPSRRGARHGRHVERLGLPTARSDANAAGAASGIEPGERCCRGGTGFRLALGSSGLPSRSLPSRPRTCSRPDRPLSAAGGTVKPRGRASRPLSSIRASASDAVIVIRPRPRRRPDRQYRIDVRIARMPGPARQTAITAAARSRRSRRSRRHRSDCRAGDGHRR